MSRPGRVEHEFVEFIPDELEPETVYIAGTYATCSHLCLCGCGNKVVTPLAPREWRLTFDGEVISLSPSIGNWSFDCQSHYWIEENLVIWARAWSKEKIEAHRARDRRQTQGFYRELQDEPSATEDGIEQTANRPGWLRRLFCPPRLRRRR